MRLPVLLACVVVVGCSQPLPPTRSAANLYRDVQRLVNVREARGWRVDRVERESLLPDAMDSVCRASPEARAAAIAWLDQRIAASGGDVEAAWRARGKKLSRVETLLELTRIRMILGAAVDAAPDCPFWIEVEEPFSGRQIGDDRWLISLEGGGKGLLLRADGETDFAGGGAGRLLIGRNFGDSWGLFTGIEAGGSAGFPRDDMGERTSLVLAVDVVAPLVVRYRLTNSYFEAEAGWIGRVNEDDADLEHGYHVGVAFGARSVRERWLMPGLALGLSYERVDAIDLFKLGLRVSFDVEL